MGKRKSKPQWDTTSHPLIRLVTIEKPENNKCWQGCGETGMLVHCWCECKIAQPLWKILRQLLKYLKIGLQIWSSKFTCGYVHKIIESRALKIYMYAHIHSSIIQNAIMWKQLMCPSTEEQISKMWSIYIQGIVFRLKKEGNSDICYNIDEPWKHNARWNKPITKRQILYDSTYTSYLDSQNNRGRE